MSDLSYVQTLNSRSERTVCPTELRVVSKNSIEKKFNTPSKFDGLRFKVRRIQKSNKNLAVRPPSAVRRTRHFCHLALTDFDEIWYVGSNWGSSCAPKILVDVGHF